KKMIKKLNNNGSSIIMVIVSMAFIGIIVGALLTAAGYAYRLRMQDVNARDNFYYVEQAMNEIYAGVGSETLENMQEAYVYTVENMVYFDIPTQTYAKISDDDAEKMFKDRFMHNLESNTYFQAANIADSLKKYITDPSVKLDESRLSVEKINVDGKLDKIIVKNVTLTRTVNYKKAVGDYTQTISADIEIGNPDFDVLFNSTSGGSPNIFTFSMVADMGIEIDSKMPITIVGNIYAAADYYNKAYDASAYDKTVKDSNRVFSKTYKDAANKDVKFEYTHGSVTSRKYDSKSPSSNTFYNLQSTIMNKTDDINRQYFDGVNKRSMYSGLFVDGSNVSILADMVIVPGSISVMDAGSLNIYGKNGSAVSETEVWADNVILGGYSLKVPTTKKDEDGNIIYDYTGSKATFRANLYVKDDTEINATASDFSLRGKYYGYGDSTTKDTRTFLPTVDTNNFQTGFVQYDSNGNVIKNGNNPVIKMENRGHYNSSAFIINGEQSTINLSETTVFFLAGRSYIELSKDVTNEEEAVKDSEGNNTTSSHINIQTVEFSPTANNFSTTTNTTDTVYLRDYKTGESLSLKSNQLAYIPVQYTGIPTEAVALDGTTHLPDDDYGNTQYDADLHPALQGSDLFEKYFPEKRFKDAKGKYAIPCIMQEVSGKKYYYYDFARAYRYIASKNSAAINALGEAYCNKFIEDFPTAEAYAASFITDYVAELNNENSVIKDYLVDITDYEGFTAGNILLPKSDTFIYSSGALTSKEGTKFNVAVSNTKNLSSLFTGEKFVDTTTSGKDVMSYSDDFEKEYNYVKWNLGHFSTAEKLEEKYVDDLVSDDNYTEASITPINKFLNFDKIGDGEKKLSLSSGYYVVYSGDTVTVNEEGIVKGIIITKGDVVFGNTVTGFEGLIVSGGKIYISNDMQTINANAEICRAILRECQLSGDHNCKDFLDLFKGFEGSEIIEDNNDTEAKTIDTIDYSDVVRINNWMKNVE
ncbi:MAG: hypothetical protein IJT72_07645, partial [Lachnospiraceae bacterium]|nr:hypothetical protein [Lachnospiraceae bacterium]